MFKNIISSLEASWSESFHLEEETTTSNFLYMLLNILVHESNDQRIRAVLECITEVDLFASNNFSFLKDFVSVLVQRQDNQACQEKLTDLCSGFEEFIIANADIMDDELFEYFSQFITETRYSTGFYLRDAIPKSFNPKVLRLFLRLFPGSEGELALLFSYDKLVVDFTRKGIHALSQLDTKESFRTLKELFPRVTVLLQREILQLMQDFTYLDASFLINTLKKTPLKKETLLLIAKLGSQTQTEAVRILLGFFNPFGLRNKLLLENLQLIADTGVRGSREMFDALAKRRLFSSRKVQELSQEITSEINGINT